MTYSNQTWHEQLDRFQVRDALLALTTSRVKLPQEAQGGHLDTLRAACGSSLEREWLDFLVESGLRLPSHAQQLVPDHFARPDFTYAEQTAVVFIDGPVHAQAHVRERDARIRDDLDLAGYTVVTFTHDTATWPELARRYAFIFGEG
ncbi:hypothetical protein ACFSC4_13040 [Deinococcus malanensis]